MDPNPTTRITRVTTIQLLVTLGIIVGVEAIAYFIPAGSLLKTGMARCLEIFLILGLFHLSDADNGIGAIGLSPKRLIFGVKKGILWSLGFAVLSVVAGGLLFLAGINPVNLFQSRLPNTVSDVVLLYIIGGLIAPVAEEIFFRGIIYSYIKSVFDFEFNLFEIVALFIASWADNNLATRYLIYQFIKKNFNIKLNFSNCSIPAAIVASTFLFVFAHQAGADIPLPQLVGGIVFCLSYEIEKSLITPMIIHSTGNMALFTLSFF